MKKIRKMKRTKHGYVCRCIGVKCKDSFSIQTSRLICARISGYKIEREQEKSTQPIYAVSRKSRGERNGGIEIGQGKETA